MRFRRFTILLPVAGFCLALACLPGCGKGKATVKGKVTFNNQPLTAGTISFMASPSRMGTGTINHDGTYIVADAPIGDVTITITTPPPVMGPMGGGMEKNQPKMPGMPKEMLPPGYEGPNKPVRVVPIPEKYNKMESSPLKYTVKKGEQTFDIKLTP